MNLAEVHKVVSRIKAAVFRRSNSDAAGVLKSHFRGTGLQFKEHRVYDHGDDVRFIDWKLLAKTNTPFVKTFEEERNVEIMAILDLSPTMFYGVNGVSKLQASIEIICLLYLLAKETSDYVHVIFKGVEVSHIPKKNGDEGITFLINQLQRMNVLSENGKINFDYHSDKKEYKPTDVGSLLHFLGKKKEVVILSDFYTFLPYEELRRLIFGRKLHAFSIVSPIDLYKKLPYALFSKNYTTGKTELGNSNSKAKEIEKILKGRVKQLNIEESYLDNFVKEMV
ncbi:MAG: DUF58 domain-containing protein [Bacteriovoracaceae bacterium]